MHRKKEIYSEKLFQSSGYSQLKQETYLIRLKCIEAIPHLFSTLLQLNQIFHMKYERKGSKLFLLQNNFIKEEPYQKLSLLPCMALQMAVYF